MHIRGAMRLCVSIYAMTCAGAAFGQTADTGAGAAVQPASAPSDHVSEGAGEIIVTAQKREQRLNDVGMSISAIGGDDLQTRGVNSVADLGKVVPGFVFSSSSFSAPVYSIRGIGFYDVSLAVTPAVTVYVDEVPLPYGAMTAQADLDLERVEVLKGPQGTVFGQNATGGAINYIAAKPTDHFSAGGDISYERFDVARIEGYVSGPLSDTVSIRVAARSTLGGDWQRSQTRDETLGSQYRMQGRILLDYHPTDRLSFLLNVNGWIDKSDPVAPQVIAYHPAHPENANVPIVDALPHSPPPSIRDADWDPGFPDRNNNFYQASLRGNYELSDDITLTSITAYAHFKESEHNDEGFAIHTNDTFLRGNISSFSQELRLGGAMGRLNWLIGGNYGHDSYLDTQFSYIDFTSNNPTFPGITPILSRALTRVDGKARTLAAFANLEYEIVDGLTIQGGIRYTDDKRKVASCFSGDPALTETFEFLQLALTGSVVPIPVGGCVTLDDTNPANLFHPTGVIDRTLHENNVSWRTGINWKITRDALVYANVSRGYKAGAFPTIPYASSSQANPVGQELVTAYEAGFKLGLLDRRLQLNGAGFYYDYKGKQLHAKVPSLVFGNLDSLLTIPKSRVWGIELQASATPVEGLDLSVGGTYLNSRIDGPFVVFPQRGPQVDVGGNPFPYTPKYMVVADGQYKWSLNDRLSAFVGAGLTYNSRTTGDIGNQDLYRIRAHTILDARIGLAGPDDKWRVTLFGSNLTNSYYWTSAYAHGADNTSRIVGRPMSYGISASFKY